MVCFASPPLFPVASLLFSVLFKRQQKRTLKEGRYSHDPSTATLLFLIEFYFPRQCATELSVVAADNQIYSFQTAKAFCFF